MEQKTFCNLVYCKILNLFLIIPPSHMSQKLLPTVKEVTKKYVRIFRKKFKPQRMSEAHTLLSS